MAANACEADALATAFAVSSPQAVPRLAARFAAIDVTGLLAAGGRLTIARRQAT
jgi:thiamine biosynthesis lipoprotein ApbE